MSSNYTQNYRLNQWEENDTVRRVDFNEDNLKIDSAIKAVDRRVDGKADVSALNAEINARSSAVASLNSSVSSLNASLSRRGNCDIRTSTYTGSGTTTKTLSFPSVPKLVIIIGPQAAAFISGNIGVAFTVESSRGTTPYVPTLTWSGAQLTISPTAGYGSDPLSIMNTSGSSYVVISFHNLS